MIEPTECDDLLQLTQRQATAIELLILGKSDAATAKEIGCHRTTISRWRVYHPAFKIQLARRHAEAFWAATERLRSLLPKALDVLENSLDGENKVATAQAIVRMAGLDKVAAPAMQTSDPDDIIVMLTRQRMDEKRKERQQRMTVDERLVAMNMPCDYEAEMKLSCEALLEVKSELRAKLSEDQMPDVELSGFDELRLVG